MSRDRLKTIGIKNWKTFNEKQVFEFSDINLLIGSNNSGKTSLVEAISLVHNIFSKNNNSLSSISLVGSLGEELKNIFHITLPDNLLHYEEFGKFISRTSTTNEFELILTVPNDLFPQKKLLLHFIYKLNPNIVTSAFLNRISIYTTLDELISTLTIDPIGGMHDTLSAHYNFQLLHPYLQKASAIQILVDRYNEILNDFLYKTGPEIEKNITVGIVHHTAEEEKLKKWDPEKYRDVVRIKNKLKAEFGLSNQDMWFWKKVSKPRDGLYFDYLFFTQDSTFIKDETLKKKALDLKSEISRAEQEWLNRLERLFLKLSAPVESIIFDYLWNNKITLTSFCQLNYVEAYYSYYNELTGASDGIPVVSINESSDIYSHIVNEIVEQRKLATDSEIKEYLNSYLIIQPYLTTRGTFWNEIAENAFKSVSISAECYFSNYKGKKLQLFYKLRNNELGIDERIFSVLGGDSLPDEIMQFINKYLKEFKIGDKLIINHLDPIRAVSFSIKKGSNEESIVQLGFGSTNILILLLSVLAVASRSRFEDIGSEVKIRRTSARHSAKGKYKYLGATLFLEEPEANLHPALQSKLAELVVEANKRFNIQFVIETHSEYLVRKLQYLVGKTELDTNKVKMWYFNTKTHDEVTNKEQAYEIEINPDGSLSREFGTGFFDEADNIALELFLLKNNQKN